LNLIRIFEEVIDLDEIAGTQIEAHNLRLDFRKGASITLRCRDDRELKQVLSRLGPNGGGAKNG
jgi:hypothetical protein